MADIPRRRHNNSALAVIVISLLVVMGLFWGLRLLASARAPQSAQDRQKAWLH